MSASATLVERACFSIPRSSPAAHPLVVAQAAASGLNRQRTSTLSSSFVQRSVDVQRRGFVSRQTSRSCCRLTCISASSAETGTLKDGIPVYKPKTYEVLVKDASRAVLAGIEDGLKRMEVDFPPLPSSVSDYTGSSESFIEANIQLALSLARKVHDTKGLKTCLVFPDNVERRQAARVFQQAIEMTPGITLGSLDDMPGSSNFLSSLRGALDLDFGSGDVAEMFKPITPADLYVVVNCSTNELPVLEKYLSSEVGDRPAVLFNLELETLRADLGLFGFPSKDLQYRFLSQFRPVYFIRQRDYSKSVAVAPFILSYSGCLLRLYPGPWQVMYKQSDGSYACVAESAKRFTLGQVKEELNISLGLNTEEEGSTLQFLRRGYKRSTWWEDDEELEQHSAWRS